MHLKAGEIGSYGFPFTLSKAGAIIEKVNLMDFDKMGPKSEAAIHLRPHDFRTLAYRTKDHDFSLNNLLKDLLSVKETYPQSA